ncbi:hypothetical protein VP01_3815g1, partial [Puccinia sorghi]
GESRFKLQNHQMQNIHSLFPGCSVQRVVTRECLLFELKKNTHLSRSFPHKPLTQLPKLFEQFHQILVGTQIATRVQAPERLPSSHKIDEDQLEKDQKQLVAEEKKRNSESRKKFKNNIDMKCIVTLKMEAKTKIRSSPKFPQMEKSRGILCGNFFLRSLKYFKIMSMIYSTQLVSGTSLIDQRDGGQTQYLLKATWRLKNGKKYPFTVKILIREFDLVSWKNILKLDAGAGYATPINWISDPQKLDQRPPKVAT